MSFWLGLLIGFIVGYFIGCVGMVLIIRDAIRAGIIENRGKAYRIVPLDEYRQVKG